LRVYDQIYSEDLVSPNGKSNSFAKSNKSTTYDASNARPPSFYDNDVEKWKEKFS
jgi:hypothetical protein